ncbi:MAG: Dephospho-CoA kinase [Bacteroidetes bacterium ADurb.Bin408]|nr:MAG: Dephospho-CoA kinase [Bacteroidetes bacterium ADurb.Bin408]
MKKIALTGNIGSGKTLVANIFQRLGAPVFNADKAGHTLLGDKDVKTQVKALFGTDIFTDNNINRAALASVVFNDKTKLEALNCIIHPKVFDCFKDFCVLHEKSPYVLFESALIFENNYQSFFDDIVLVYAPEDIRLKRLMLRDNNSEAAVKARMNNQLDDDMKRDKVSYIILNDDKTLVLPQVLKLHDIFKGI